MKIFSYSYYLVHSSIKIGVALSIALSLLLSASAWAQLISLQSEPKLQAIADELVAENYYTRADLDTIFAKSSYLQTVLDAMKNPAEYKFTWGKYRKIFMQDERIQQGVDFWIEHNQTLHKAEQNFGVPASIIVAIIGVESKYGKYRGKHRVLDSLATLVIDFPRRSAFFAAELKQFLILCKENGLDPNGVLGSYAGAMGYPQFISSSYRNYAVDFSGDGVTDLVDQPVDAIGSVANYFIENGWKPGQQVTSAAQFSVDPRIEELANRKRKVKYSAAELRAQGARLDDSISNSDKLNVLMLDASEVVKEPEEQNRYIVRAGDTACEIAEKFDVACSALFKLNKLNQNGAIYRGQRLKLPILKSATASKSTSKNKTEKQGKWEIKGDSESESSQILKRFFYTHPNFYAITQYNHSVLYAMAVYDLSVAIAQAKQQRDAFINELKNDTQLPVPEANSATVGEG